MRDSSNIVEMVASARRDLEELKELQFFGADALKVNSWSTSVSNSSDTYRLTLEPDTPGTVLPMQLERGWVYNGSYGAAFEGATIYQRYTSDDTFQWDVSFMANTSEISSASVHLSWLGDATVTWVKV